MVSVLYLCFTDFNPEPQVKIWCGWFLVLVAIGNLVWPNGTMMVQGLYPDIRDALNGSTKSTKIKGLKKFEQHRADLIVKYDLQVKEEFEEGEEKEDKNHPKGNQVCDPSYFPETSGIEEVYTTRKDRREGVREFKPIAQWVLGKEMDNEDIMSQVYEQPASAEFSVQEGSFSD